MQDWSPRSHVGGLGDGPMASMIAECDSWWGRRSDGRSCRSPVPGRVGREVGSVVAVTASGRCGRASGMGARRVDHGRVPTRQPRRIGPAGSGRTPASRPIPPHRTNAARAALRVETGTEGIAGPGPIGPGRLEPRSERRNLAGSPLCARPRCAPQSRSAVEGDSDLVHAGPSSVTHLRLTCFLIILTLPRGRATATVLLPTNRRLEESDGGVF